MRANPATSIRRGTVSSDDSPILHAPIANAITVSGTFSQKIHRHPTVSVSSPPINGPAALPNPAMPYANPIAWLARAAGNALVNTLTETGKMSAAPSPCSARNAMTRVADGDTAHTEPLGTGTTANETPTSADSLEGIEIQLTPVAEVRMPVAMAARPTTNELYIAEQGGRVRKVTIDRSEPEPAYDLQSQPALDISDLYQQWQSDGTFDDMVPWGYQKWDYNGKHPGITWQFDIRAIYYRKDLLEQAGLKVPTTWDELLAAAKKLTNADKSQIGIAVPGKQGSYDTDQFYMTLVMQAGGGLADAEGNPTFDSPEQLKARMAEKERPASPRG